MNILGRLKELAYHEIQAVEPPDRDAADLIEEQFGFRVPTDYAEFLRAYPGSGTFGYSVGFIGDSACHGSPNTEYLVGSLFGIGPELKLNVLNSNPNDELIELVSQGADYFVIGDDFGGDRICLKVSSDDFGAIFLYVRGLPDPPARLCDSFSDMISRMYVKEE